MIYKRKARDGRVRYTVVVMLAPINGTAQRRKTIGTFATKAEAEREERAARSAQDRGIDLAPGTVSVEEMLSRYMRAKAVDRWGMKTQERSHDLARLYILPHLGAMKVAKIRPAHLAQWTTELRQRGGRLSLANGTVRTRPLSPKSVNHCFTLLKAAFRWGLRMQLVANNPFDAIESPKVPRKEAKALTSDQVVSLLDAVEGGQWKNVIQFALATGARRGEIAALKHADVDLAVGVVIISKSLSDTRNGVFEKPTKTERIRIVRLSLDAREAVRRERLKQERAKRWGTQPFQDSGHAFQYPAGGRIRPYDLSDAFRKVAKRAGLSVTSLHALRHTAGTVMIKNGTDVRTVAEILGHSTPVTTLNVYAHAVPGAQDAAVNAIDAFVASAMQQECNTSATEIEKAQ